MASPRVTKSPKNDITNVCGVKELVETPSTRSASYSLTDDDHHLKKSPPSPSVSGKVPSIVTRARHKQTSVKTSPVKNSTTFIKKEVPDTEVSVDQRNVALPEVKVTLL
jgi:NaMN:DMB phosphoribosyltransferase